MLSYLRRHWLLYLILTALAIALGLGASYVVGVIGSTPDSVREERVASEEDHADDMNSIDADLSGDAAATDGGAADAAATDGATTQ